MHVKARAAFGCKFVVAVDFEWAVLPLHRIDQFAQLEGLLRSKVSEKIICSARTVPAEQSDTD